MSVINLFNLVLYEKSFKTGMSVINLFNNVLFEKTQ